MWKWVPAVCMTYSSVKQQVFPGRKNKRAAVHFRVISFTTGEKQKRKERFFLFPFFASGAIFFYVATAASRYFV